MSAFKVKPGTRIRTRRLAGEPWFYGLVVRQDESGLIHVADSSSRMRSITSVDWQWMEEAGNLERQAPDDVSRRRAALLDTLTTPVRRFH